MTFELRYTSSGTLVSTHGSEESALQEVRWMVWACGRALVERLMLLASDARGTSERMHAGETLIHRALECDAPALTFAPVFHGA